jgi:hypothetical protein
METLIIKTDAFTLRDDEFFRFCEENRDLRIEKDKAQNIIISLT